MGNDGGSIPTRRELVKSPTRQKTTSEVRSQNSQNSTYHWTFCPLSKKPLQSPISSDCLGRLFNKEGVLEWLTNSEEFGDGEEVMKAAGVKGLKDLVEVKFEVSEESSAESSTNGGANGGTGRKETWVCPVTRKELGPGSHAVYLVPCGHAFAESAVKEIQEDTCLVCSSPFSKEDGVVKINPTETADIDKLKARMERLKEAGLSHSMKKSSSKKRKKGDKDKDAENGESSSKDKKDKPSIKSDIVAKVVEEQERAKKRKVDRSDNVKSLFTSSSKNMTGKSRDSDFMSRGFTMPVKGR